MVGMMMMGERLTALFLLLGEGCRTTLAPALG